VPPQAILRKGVGEALVLLHGFCSAAAGWQPTLDGLGGSFDVIAPDWPGFGGSIDRRPCHSVDEMADRVVRLADALELQTFHLLGHSMSGFVVQALLLRHPARVRKAVLYGAGLATNRSGRFESLHATVGRLRRQGVTATAEHVCGTWFVQGNLAKPYTECVSLGARMDAEAGIAALKACESIDFAGRMSGISNPVLVIVGDRDRTFSVDDALRLAAAFPHSSLCVLPDCAHAAHLERPALFSAVVAEFLTGAAESVVGSVDR